MKTHILYCQKKGYKDYFSGIYDGTLDKEGLALVDFKWSIHKDDATSLETPVAWDLLRMCRLEWPHLTLHVERIVTLEQIQTYFA